MNTKGIKFLAVLAVLAMAFAAFAVIADAETDDASAPTITGTWGADVNTSGYAINSIVNVYFSKDAYIASEKSGVISGAFPKMVGTEVVGDGASSATTWSQLFGTTYQNTGYSYVIIEITDAAVGDTFGGIRTSESDAPMTIGSIDEPYTMVAASIDGGAFHCIYAIKTGYVTKMKYVDADNEERTCEFTLDLSNGKVMPKASFTGTAGSYTMTLTEDSILPMDKTKTITFWGSTQFYNGVTGAGVYTVNLGGHKLFSNGVAFLLGGNTTGTTDNMLLKINGSAAGSEIDSKSIVVFNNYVKGSAAASLDGKERVGANLDINGGTYNSDSRVIRWMPYASGTTIYSTDVTINNAVMNTIESGIWIGNGAVKDVAITNSTVIVGDEDTKGGIGIYLGTSKNSTLSNNIVTVVNGETALEIKSGKATVESGSYTASAYESITKTSTPGSNGSGGGISTVLINNHYESIGGAVEVAFNNVTLKNTAQNSYEIIVAIAAGDSNITFSDNGEHSVIITEYQKDVTSPKDVVLKNSRFSDFMVDSLVSGDEGTSITESNKVVASGSIILAGKISTTFKIENDAGHDAKVIENVETGKTIDEVINGYESESVDSIVKTNSAIASQLAAEGKTVKVEQANLALVAGDAKTLTNFDIVVKSASGDSKELSFTGFTEITGTIKTTDGTTTQSLKLDKVQGDIKIYKGSIIIDGKDASGTFILDAGADVIMSGNLKGGNLTIKMADTTKAAIVTIEEGSEVTIDDGSTLSIEKGVTLNVAGKLTSTVADSKLQVKSSSVAYITGTVSVDKVENAGTVKIDDGGKLKSLTAMNGTGKYNALYGSSVEGAYTADASATPLFTAYSGSDINKLAVTNWQNVIGKDAASGSWTVATSTGPIYALKLENYNGTYNFKSISSNIASLILVGDNSLTYSVSDYTANDALFGAKLATIETVQGSGSVDVEIDMSNVSKESIEGFTYYAIKSTEAKLLVDSVDVSIEMKGTGSSWTAANIKAVGISATAIDVDNSELAVDVLSVYTAKKSNIYGVTTGALTVNTSDVHIASAGTALKTTGTLTAKISSHVNASGKAMGFDGTAATAMDISGASAVIVFGGADVSGDVKLKQDSSLAVENLTYNLGTLTNDGKVFLDGKAVIIEGAHVVNNAEFKVDGSMNVFGELKNKSGTFTNDGTIIVFAKKANGTIANKTVTFTPAAAASVVTKTAQLSTINVKEWELQTDGSIKVKKADVTFVYRDGEAITPAADAFTGTITPVQSASTNYYSMSLTNGTATIGLTYSVGDTADLGKQYTLSLSGYVIDKTTPTDANKRTIVAPASTPISGDEVATYVIQNIGASSAFEVEGGKFVNNSTIGYYGSVEKVIVGNGAEFEGDLTVGVQTVFINGKFTGDLTTAGAVEIKKATAPAADGKFYGNINAVGLVTVSGTVEGDNIITSTGVTSTGTIKSNITSEGSVTVKNLTGDITVNREAAGVITVTITGKVSGDLTYVSKYKATKDAETKTIYTASLELETDLTVPTSSPAKSMIIDLVAGADATESKAVEPGYFAFGLKTDAPGTGKNVNINVTKGKFAFPSSLVLPVRYAMVFEAGSIIEVSSIAILDVTEAAIKVSKDAESHFVTGTTPITDYGVVKCIMSFTVQDGAYTIYSDVAYAVANCDEGSTLTVEAVTAPINDTITIPKNVNVVVSNGSTMTFGTNGLNMSEGAKITLVGTGKVTFGETGKTADTEWEVLTINGTIVYEDNAILFDGIRFNDAINTVGGIAATSTAASKLNVNLSYKDGTATIKSGIGIGSIILTNGTEVKEKDADPEQIRGIFVIGADAVFDASSIKDEFGVCTYKKSGDDYVIDKVVILPTIVGVEGTLNLLNDTNVKGTYAGLGTVTVSKKLTIEKGDNIAAVETEYNVSPTVAIMITDKDGNNAVAFNLVQASIKAADAALIITAEKIKDVNALTIAGSVGAGGISSEDTIYMKGVKVLEDASIVADTVYVITSESTATGYVGAKTIYMKDTDTSYAKLSYKVTFEKEDYTFYTDFASIDFDEISDITIADDVVITKKTDLSGKDVNIVIAEGKTLTIKNNFIIGTPATTLGEEGSSIVGKVVIDNTGVGAGKGYYLVAYADVDLMFAEIVAINNDGVTKSDAVWSKLDVEETVYAVIFAEDDTVVLAKADGPLVPEIEGYNFTAWLNYNGDSDATVGDTNAYAMAKAILVYVTVKYVEGVSYYCNGIEFAIYDTPTKVDYGSTFVAKISDTSKYQGTPLVNGKNSLTVYEDAVLVATGVEPIPVPPQPEPEPVVGDSGLSLTDILLIVLVILIAIMVVILVLRLNRS